MTGSPDENMPCEVESKPDAVLARLRELEEENARLKAALSQTVDEDAAQSLPPLQARVLLLGNSGVGKSCLMTRFASGHYTNNNTATIGVDLQYKMLYVNGRRCKLCVVDTAGQEKFRSVARSHYRGAQGALFVYDVTDRSTFTSLEQWCADWREYGSVEGAVCMLVANKVDLSSARGVSEEEGRDMAARVGCRYVETSAKEDLAVDQAFAQLLVDIVEQPSLLAAAAAGYGYGNSSGMMGTAVGAGCGTVHLHGGGQHRRHGLHQCCGL